MSYDHTEFEMHGFKCAIAYDHDAESPEGWGYADYFLGELDHSRYSKMGREGCDKRDAWRYLPFGEGPWEFGSRLQEDEYWQREDEADLREAWEDEQETGFEVFAVELVDYGSNGVALRYCDHEEANGYIFIKVPWESELERIAHPDFDPKAMADGVMEEWSQYLEGDVHWARVEDSDGETIESCGGFYGIDAAKEWCEEMAECLRSRTRTMSVVVTHGSLPLPLPASVRSDVLQIEVPLSVGDDSVPKWATTEGPFSNDPDVLQVNLCTPMARGFHPLPLSMSQCR